MIVVTGGAGFIGSVLVHELNKRGKTDICIVDHLGTSEKWKNLVSLRYLEYFDKNKFIELLEARYFGNTIEVIFHLGACSSTTEQNADYLMENNYRYTMRLAQWREKHPHVRLIYASSAATYGDGEKGYSDNEALLTTLQPLNMYGYSKHLFDLHAHRAGWLKNIVGLKFFNVFGPNEYHKNEMRSIICKAYPRVRDIGTMSLFKSYRSGIADGDQRRDFVYVKDAVTMTLFFLDNPSIGGIFNVGSGTAHSWNELATALFKAANRPCAIDYIPMPEVLREKYQYFTRADMSKMHSVGYTRQPMPLEQSIDDYVKTYLVSNTYTGSEPVIS